MAPSLPFINVSHLASSWTHSVPFTGDWNVESLRELVRLELVWRKALPDDIVQDLDTLFARAKKQGRSTWAPIRSNAELNQWRDLDKCCFTVAPGDSVAGIPKVRTSDLKQAWREWCERHEDAIREAEEQIEAGHRKPSKPSALRTAMWVINTDFHPRMGRR